MLKGENIICIAGEGWGGLWRRRHALMTQFARYNRVLFIAPPLSILSPFSSFSKWGWKDLLYLGRVRCVAENLFVYQCWNVFPFARFRIISKINKFFIERSLKKNAKILKLQNPILWITINSNLRTYIGFFQEKLICYDCQDRWIVSDGSIRSRESLRAIVLWESDVLQKADVVFGVSDEIVEDLKKLNNKVYCVSNGVDYELFSKATAHSTKIPNEMKRLKKPVLGYSGGLQFKVDFELLILLAKSMPDVSLVLIGPMYINNSLDKKAIQHLKGLKNVHFLGRKPRELLPEYLKGVDVCLMPLKRTDLNRYGCPNKLLEYAAAGKPIEAMNQGRPYAYEKIMAIARSREDFVTHVNQSIHEDCDANTIKRRQEIARENSWDRRAEDIMAIVAKQLDTICTQK